MASKTTLFRSKFTDVHIPDNVSLPEFVFRNFDKFSTSEDMKNGDAPVLIDGPSGRTISFNQLRSRSRQCSAGLASLGFKKGDVFCIFSPNLPEFAIAFFGVVQLGGIVTTCNPIYNAEELATQLNHSNAKFLVTVPSFLKKAIAAKAKARCLKKIFLFGTKQATNGHAAFASLLTHGSDIPDVKINPKEDVVCLPYSSGTTGLPKGVMLTHYSIIANLCQVTAPALIQLGKDDTLIGVLPFFHIYGMVVILNAAVMLGAKVVTMPRFLPKMFLELIQKYRVTVAHVVPPLVLFLTKHPLVAQFDLSSLKEVFCGAAPLGPEITAACIKRLNLKCLRQGYGMTEMSPASHVSPATGAVAGSAGVLIPNTICKIVDPTTGKALPCNKRGELWIKGPQLMKGYLHNQKATAATIDRDGFIHTGDIAYVDENGHFFVVDRLKELIKVKGFQVAPAELEALLLSHPNIADAAVVPQPDDKSGEIPKAYIVKRGAITAEEVMSFVASRVAKYKRIRVVEFTKQIPKSASGKILRRILRAQTREQLQKQRKQMPKKPAKPIIHRSRFPAVNIPNLPIHKFILRNFPKYGDRVALVDQKGISKIKFSDIPRLMRRCGAGLTKLKFTKGDVFCIFSPNLPAFAIAWFGVVSIGGVLTTCNPSYTANELAHQLNDSKAKFLLTVPSFLATAKEAVVKAKSVTRIFVFGDIKESLMRVIPHGKDVQASSTGTETRTGTISITKETPTQTITTTTTTTVTTTITYHGVRRRIVTIASFSSLLKNDGSAFPEVKFDVKKDLVCLPYSSGTTGLPKGVMLTHYNMVANLCQLTAPSLLNLGEKDVLIGVLPFFHIYGLVVILNAALMVGTKIVTMTRFVPQTFLQLIQQHKVTVAPVVPPLVLFLAKHPVIAKFDLSSLKEVFCGAAPLGPEISRLCVKRLNLRCFRQGYGMTELSPVSHISPSSNPVLGSAGMLVPNTLCKIVDIKTGYTLAHDKRGEIWVKGPQVMMGYLNNAKATAHTIDKDGFLHTGDIGYVNKDGHYFVVDRLKELIKYKGFQVAPAELEAILLSHPNIADAAVIPQPDEKAGEVPRAYIVRKGAITAEEVMNFVAGKVAKYKRIRFVEFAKTIPKSLSGKILRRVLKKQLKEQMAKQQQ